MVVEIGSSNTMLVAPKQVRLAPVSLLSTWDSIARLITTPLFLQANSLSFVHSVNVLLLPSERCEHLNSDQGAPFFLDPVKNSDSNVSSHPVTGSQTLPLK